MKTEVDKGMRTVSTQLWSVQSVFSAIWAATTYFTGPPRVLGMLYKRLLFPRKCSRFAIGNLVVLQIDREDVKTRLLEYSMTAAVQDRGFVYVITPFVVELLRAWSEGGQKM